MARETSTFTQSNTTQAKRAVGWIGRAYAVYANALKTFRHRREVTALLRMDDSMLRDIGVTRNDVESVLAGSLFYDASWRLSERALEARSAHRLQKQDDFRWARGGEDNQTPKPRTAPMGRAA